MWISSNHVVFTGHLWSNLSLRLISQKSPQTLPAQQVTLKWSEIIHHWQSPSLLQRKDWISWMSMKAWTNWDGNKVNTEVWLHFYPVLESFTLFIKYFLRVSEWPDSAHIGAFCLPDVSPAECVCEFSYWKRHDCQHRAQYNKINW